MKHTTVGRALGLVGLALMAVSLSSCTGTDNRKPVFAVAGKVTFKDEPMAGAMITFHPLNDPDPRALRSQATTDKDGSFKLSTYLKEDGAPAGEYAVTIYWPGKRAAKGKAADPSAEEEDLPPDRLNRLYANPTTTKLRATVREQPNTIDFTLP